MSRVSLSVNGEAVEAEVEPRTHLADLLREQLLLTGTHLGCEHGVCGACTVLLDDEPARSCIAFAVACEGAQVRTIEGFPDDPLMGALRAAFTAHHALQCGYCTPGMLITAYDIVRRLPGADEARVREELGGNLCRCTGYVGIVAAIRSVLASPPAAAPLPSAPRELARLAHRLPRAESAPGTGSGNGSGIRSGTGPGAGSSARPGAGIERTVVLAMPADALWELVRQPQEMVGCLPGAVLEETQADGRLALRFAVAIGPMRATFVGPADVHYDDHARSGRLGGTGRDGLSRTQASGAIAFAVAPSGEGSSLALRIDYALQGPLAQFSRGAVVEAVVDQLLARFAENIERRGAGEMPDQIQAGGEPAPVGGVGLLLRALWQRIRG